MARTTRSQSADTSHVFPSITNQNYFSDYFLSYRLNDGLGSLYKRWNELEKDGQSTSRTRVRSLTSSFRKYRADAAFASPGADQGDEEFDLGLIPVDAIDALQHLNDDVLTALGWEPTRGETVALTSGGHIVHVPVAHHARTPSGGLLIALDAVFATDPATVVAGKEALAGMLLDPVRVGEKAEGTTVLEAAQLIFTADESPSYLLICSGGSVTLLDRDRWGEGVFLGADLDDALARGDAAAKGELAAIAALFSADVINPGEDAESLLSGLHDMAVNESAGVSKDLRHGVRRSVETLANAVVEDIRHRQKGPWRQVDPDELTKQSLRYIYRIIVLLFAEARPELGILPTDNRDYQAGYSLARLRDAALTDLHSDNARNSAHIQESLRLLFDLVGDGYEPPATLRTDARGVSFPELGSALFSRDACPLLDKARITDEKLQSVIVNLCFTREKTGTQRQILSYATLGINQLGAVYEGLMAYKGFLATEELFEIDDDGDPDNGSWVIPVGRGNEFSDDVFLREAGPDGQGRRVRYREGDFVFRLSGRDRQRSASYYTPEVLTEFTVRHTLDVYWEEHPDITAGEILKLTVCEPALGSGAFLNEAINQLASRYLKAAQDESGETIDADRYQHELQKVKAHFAINQAYGVDLNPTAVELAEVSLWLNCMHEGLRAPQLGGRLRRGNSLIGARRATYTVEQINTQPWKGTRRRPVIAPTVERIADVPLGDAAGIHQFLLPGEGWGAAADAVELKGKGGRNPVEGLAEDWSVAVRSWRTATQKVPTKPQMDRLVALARRVDAAWQRAAVNCAEYHEAHSRSVAVWGASPEDLPQDGIASSSRFLDPEGPATRLRLLMDAWHALWMWAPADGEELPTFDQWLEAFELLLGQPEPDEVGELFSSYELHDGALESVAMFGRATVSEAVGRYPWLARCREIAEREGFFHWEVEHAPVFAEGGFDVQVGNPPWVRPTWDEPACLAEHDPWWGIADLKQTADATKRARREGSLAVTVAADLYRRDRADNAGLNALLGAETLAEDLVGVQTNLYMVFMAATWRRSNRTGAVGLLHPESHFVDPKTGSLRAQTYARLRRHWQFTNALFLFEDVHHVTEFGVNVYAADREPQFLQAVNLLVPATLDRSLDHDGTGEAPGIRYAEGGWDLRPHLDRIVTVDQDVLADWVRLFDDAGTPPEESRLVRPLTVGDLGALAVFSNQPNRLVDEEYFWTAGLHEKSAKDDGTIVWRTEVPKSSEDCILQGPHIVNMAPYAQQPRPGCKGQTDWEAVELETLPVDYIPRTNYQRELPADAFQSRNPVWEKETFTARFREVHRGFVNSSLVRTLQACILPPGPSIIASLVAIGRQSNADTAVWAGLLGSLPYDYLVKVSGVSNIRKYVTDALPVPVFNDTLVQALLLRTLRLNCVSTEYAPLWAELFDEKWRDDAFTDVASGAIDISDVEKEWSHSAPLRGELDRWIASCEIDALVALTLGLSQDQLVQMYRTQFAVLRKYESQMVFDRNGRQICGDYHAYGFKQAEWEAELKAAPAKRGQSKVKMWARVLEYLDGNTGVDLGPFVPPFRPADREATMRRAYRAFSQRLEGDSK